MQAMTATLQVRAPAVAGLFYPGDPEALRREVADHTAAGAGAAMPFKAIVAPHAGYRYSGPIAGTAYAAIRHQAGQVRRVVLIGPAHRFGFRGIAIPGDDGLATPLGVVTVDRASLDSLRPLPGVRVLDRAFAGEHALEVHLPFLQVLFPGAVVVPVLVGDAPPEQVETVLARLWGGPETLIVVSSDLSHYHDYETARRLDRQAAQAIEALAGDRLDGQAACGYLPVAGLLRRAEALDLRATALDLRNSGDTSGTTDPVVGYGAFGFEVADGARLDDTARATLLDVARRALVHAAHTGQPLPIDADDYPLPVRAARRAFVTLTQDGQLRGCIGTLTADTPLVVAIAENSFRAARQDPRFDALSPDEIAATAIAISILSHPRPMRFAGEADLLAQLRPGHDGLIIKEGRHQALFLPKVWDVLPDPVQFLAHLKQKAGLPADPPSPALQAFCFTTETFSGES
jgi:AmmeMemoRadiSam system protein B/AmmeMemoRadiSam system protein A